MVQDKHRNWLSRIVLKDPIQFAGIIIALLVSIMSFGFSACANYLARQANDLAQEANRHSERANEIAYIDEEVRQVIFWQRRLVTDLARCRGTYKDFINSSPNPEPQTLYAVLKDNCGSDVMLETVKSLSDYSYDGLLNHYSFNNYNCSMYFSEIASLLKYTEENADFDEYDSGRFLTAIVAADSEFAADSAKSMVMNPDYLIECLSEVSNRDIHDYYSEMLLIEK